MTETEWLRSPDVGAMLEFLGAKASPRLLLLFACGSCRQIPALLTDERSRQAVEITERFADGEVGAEELRLAHRLARAAMEENWRGPAPRAVVRAVRTALTRIRTDLPQRGAGSLHVELVSTVGRAAEALKAADKGKSQTQSEPLRQPELSFTFRAADGGLSKPSPLQCALLRDLFGNPFRRVAVDPAWLRWNDDCVQRVAGGIYEGYRFDELPILADALEEAGCDIDQMLAHCRGGGPHARGCWVVDLILGREREA